MLFVAIHCLLPTLTPSAWQIQGLLLRAPQQNPLDEAEQDHRRLQAKDGRADWQQIR